MPRIRVCHCRLNALWLFWVLQTPFTSLHTTLPARLSNNSPNGSVAQRLPPMLLEVGAQLVWCRVVCRLCHTSLNQLVVSTATQTTTSATTTSPSALRQIHTACHIFMASHLSNQLKHLFIMVDHHSTVTLVLVHINRTTVIMYLNRVTLELRNSLCKEWFPVSH